MNPRLLLASLAFLTARAAFPDHQAERIVDAIYRVEGGTRARVPYGILSVPVRDAAHARRICKRTVQNNHDRWMDAGQPGEYLDFLANRYCPPSVDPIGNRNWKRNIRAILSR